MFKMSQKAISVILLSVFMLSFVNCSKVKFESANLNNKLVKDNLGDGDPSLGPDSDDSDYLIYNPEEYSDVEVPAQVLVVEDSKLISPNKASELNDLLQLPVTMIQEQQNPLLNDLLNNLSEQLANNRDRSECGVYSVFVANKHLIQNKTAIRHPYGYTISRVDSVISITDGNGMVIFSADEYTSYIEEISNVSGMIVSCGVSIGKVSQIATTNLTVYNANIGEISKARAIIRVVNGTIGEVHGFTGNLTGKVTGEISDFNGYLNESYLNVQ